MHLRQWHVEADSHHLRSQTIRMMNSRSEQRSKVPISNLGSGLVVFREDIVTIGCTAVTFGATWCHDVVTLISVLSGLTAV